MDRLSKADIVSALEALSTKLRLLNEPCELILVGGAALVLLFDARQATKDFDAILVTGSRTALDEAVAAVAEQLHLPTAWLNDGAKGYIHGLSPGSVVFSSPALLVKTLSIEQLLAMKLSAWRDELDIADARLLMSTISGRRDEVWKLVQPYLVPGRQLKARYAFDDLWESLHGSA